MSAEALLPCPFCGTQGRHYGGHVRCPNNACGVEVSALNAEQWNTRAGFQWPEGVHNMTHHEFEEASGWTIGERYIYDSPPTHAQGGTRK